MSSLLSARSSTQTPNPSIARAQANSCDRAAGLADVGVRLEIWPKMFHIWPNYHQVLAQRRQPGNNVQDILGSLVRWIDMGGADG